jgi:hypothetical protein
VTLLAPDPPYLGFRYTNLPANPSSTPGTSVTPGASNADGSYTQIASSANIAEDIVAFTMRIIGGGTAANAKPQVMDIGVDPAGGTSYTAIVTKFPMGASGTSSSQFGYQFCFPLRIKAGSSVAVRIKGANATAGTVTVQAFFYGGGIGRPMNLKCAGAYAETIGTITNSLGVSFTPGNAADGSWTLLGATTKKHWWWQIAYQIDNSTITAEQTYIEIAHGDASNKHIINRLLHMGDTSERCGDFLAANMNAFAAYCPVLAGTNIYIRGRTPNAPDTGYNAAAIGIGG